MTDKAISPLRRRLIEDMTIRRLGPGTQHQYVRHVKSFADFVGRPPDKATHPKPLLRSVADPLLQGRVIVSLSLMCGAAPVRAALHPVCHPTVLEAQPRTSCPAGRAPPRS